MSKRKLSVSVAKGQMSLFGSDKIYKCGAVRSLLFVRDCRTLENTLNELPVYRMLNWAAGEPRLVTTRQLRGVFVTLPNLRPYNQFLSRVPREEFANSPFNRPVLLNRNLGALHARLLELCETINVKFGEAVNHITIQSYDSTNKSHHNAHRDKTQSWVDGASFFVLSLGETRIFRVKPWNHDAGKPFQNSPEEDDIDLPDGSLLKVPGATNNNYSHEVPNSSALTETRFSIVFRHMTQT